MQLSMQISSVSGNLPTQGYQPYLAADDETDQDDFAMGSNTQSPAAKSATAQNVGVNIDITA